MKTCPECFGDGYEHDEKGFKTGHICTTCGGDGEVSDKVYEQYHYFFGSRWEDDPEYVNESWRIRREENRMTPTERNMVNEAYGSSGGGKCGLIVGFAFISPIVAALHFLTQWNV